MRAPLLAALALLAAGCVTAPSPSAVSSDAAHASPTFASARVIDPARGQGEPSLGVAPDGSAFYANRGGEVLVTRDEGATWTSLGDPTKPMPDEDADIAVDKDGTIWDSTLYVGCSTTATSRDQGKSWTVSELGCFGPGGDRQYVVPTTKGTAFLYSHPYYQMIAKTTDHGATWLPSGIAEGPLGVTQGASGWGGGGFWNEAKNSVHLTWTWYDSTIDAQDGAQTRAARPADAITRDGGATWQMTQAPSAGGVALGLGLVMGAADRAGNVYLTWGEAKGDDITIYLASSTDDGKTWSKPRVVDADAGSKVFPAIAALAPGRVAIAYYHADQRGYPSSVPKDARWNVTLAWTRDALADAPAFERANLSTHALRTGPICPDGTICQGNRQLLDYFALKAAPDGRVASVWTSTDDVKGKTVNVFGLTTDALLAG